MKHTPEELLAAFAKLDSTAVSDALDALELTPGQGGFRLVSVDRSIAGFAVTVELEPWKPGPAGAHIATEAVAKAGPGEIIVVANQGRTDVSAWGGLLSLGASLNGAHGVVVDGSCRDVGEARELGFPVFARATIPATARGRLQQRSTGLPVNFGAATVAPGDIVIADETGITFVPKQHLEEVLTLAQGIAAREEAIAADLRRGIPLPEAMHDARLAGTTQEN